MNFFPFDIHNDQDDPQYESFDGRAQTLPPLQPLLRRKAARLLTSKMRGKCLRKIFLHLGKKRKTKNSPLGAFGSWPKKSARSYLEARSIHRFARPRQHEKGNKELGEKTSRRRFRPCPVSEGHPLPRLLSRA